MPASPVSASLFIFVLEILGNQIGNNYKITGPSIQRNIKTDDSVEIVQHAYDCTSTMKKWQ